MLHQIGVGALGPVFRTYEPTRDRLVAVKVFRLDITPEQSQALADELAAAAEAGLFHPSVIEPIASGIEGTLAYRAEEYVAAESLDVAMRHYAPAPAEKVLPFITQLAGAIDFARTAGIGHGALHPRDVFLTPDEARATGFGVVEALERVGLRAPVRRPYSAPERVAGSSWSTPADVFSLAAIAYEMLTGRRPAGTGPQIGAVDGDRGAALHDVLARAMDESPARRYPTALAFASAFESAARPGASVRSSPSAVVAPFPAPDSKGAPRLPADDRAERPAEVLDFAPAAQDDERDDARYGFDDDEPVLDATSPEADLLGDADLDLPLDDFVIADPVPTRAPENVPPPIAAVSSRQDRLFDVDESTDDRDDVAFGASDRVEDRISGRDPLSYESETHERSGWSTLAVVLFSILLMGLAFAAGYVVRDRTQRTGSDSIAGDAAAGPGGTTASATSGTQPPKQDVPKTDAPKDFSEQPVNPPAAKPSTPPPAISETPAPSAAPVPAPSAPPAPTTGRIVVRSAPAGAAVVVNGRWRGRTPLTMDKLAFRSYAVSVSQTGFATARENVKLTAADPSQTVNLELERKAAPAPAQKAAPRPTREAPEPPTPLGSLYIDSRPRGARVFVDGKPVGVTPVAVPDLRSGSHVVRMELADHRPWTTSARVRAGEQERVSGSLEVIR